MQTANLHLNVNVRGFTEEDSRRILRTYLEEVNTFIVKLARKKDVHITKLYYDSGDAK